MDKGLNKTSKHSKGNRFCQSTVNSHKTDILAGKRLFNNQSTCEFTVPTIYFYRKYSRFTGTAIAPFISTSKFTGT